MRRLKNLSSAVISIALRFISRDSVDLLFPIRRAIGGFIGKRRPRVAGATRGLGAGVVGVRPREGGGEWPSTCDEGAGAFSATVGVGEPCSSPSFSRFFFVIGVLPAACVGSGRCLGLLAAR
jgi:hypothetical protein